MLTIITLSRHLYYFQSLADALNEQIGLLVHQVPVEAILVNNAGHPSLTGFALRRGWMAIEPGYNTSFSVGNNLAARAARPETTHLLLLNDDLRPGPTFLRTMWSRRDCAEIVGAALLHSDGTANHLGTMVSASTARTDHIGRGGAYEPSGGAYVPSVTFAAALIRRELWDALEGLDERYYYGFEDTDFCLRALRLGASVWCARQAVATHDECGTRPRGGAADVTNMRTFQDTWGAQLPSLLQSYALRRPGAEGVLP